MHWRTGRSLWEHAHVAGLAVKQPGAAVYLQWLLRARDRDEVGGDGGQKSSHISGQSRIRRPHHPPTPLHFPGPRALDLWGSPGEGDPPFVRRLTNFTY